MYKSTFKILRRYFKSYGGITEILKSPYLHVSFIVTILLHERWSNAGWWDDSINIIPNLLGFSLGGFAIIISFGSEKFQQLISRCDEKENTSIMGEISTTFLHFIIIQTISFVCSLIARTWQLTSSFEQIYIKIKENKLCSIDMENIFISFFAFFCYLTFVYAIFLTIAAAISIYRMCGWYEKFNGKTSGKH